MVSCHEQNHPPHDRAEQDLRIKLKTAANQLTETNQGLKYNPIILFYGPVSRTRPQSRQEVIIPESVICPVLSVTRMQL